MGIRCDLGTSGNMRGNMYRGVGCGSTVEINPVFNSGTKIADYSIDGEESEIYIPNYPQYTESVLYTYSGNTRQTTFNLSDSMSNYDALIFTFGWTLGGTNFETVDVIPTSKLENNYFLCSGGEGRYNYVSKGVDNTEIILNTSGGSWDGASIIREVRGIKY